MFFEILKLFLPNQNHPKLKDTNKHQGLRNQLVKQLEEKGITDKNVLAAIGKIPRHLFLDSSFENFAYQDKAFPIEAGQTISQPYTVAFQSQLLEVEKDHKILDSRDSKQFTFYNINIKKISKISKFFFIYLSNQFLIEYLLFLNLYKYLQL